MASEHFAEAAREDLAIAKSEIENAKSRPIEARDVVKVDRSVRPVTTFYTNLSPSFWMKDFQPQTITMVSCGVNGFYEGK
jgi:hypothetical protein